MTHQLKTYMREFALAVAGGCCIGIGGIIYMMCSTPLLGAFLFAVGLCTILMMGLKLYTGMVGYILNNKPKYLIDLLIVWLGNFVGTTVVGGLIRFTRIGDKLQQSANNIVQTKLDDNAVSLILLGVFCGILMFVGVDCFKTYWAGKDFAAVIMPILCVAVFILAGFEHCIADMVYFAVAGRIIEGLPVLLWVTIGNTLGGMLFGLVKKK